MAAANQYDRQNDAELGSGIYDKTKSKEPALCGCGAPIENPWYGSRDCFACQRKLRMEYNRIYPVFEDAVSTLMSAVITVYDEPQDIADAVALAYMEHPGPEQEEQDEISECDICGRLECDCAGYNQNQVSPEKLARMIAETEARYPEAWKHPAKSDRGKYTKMDVYWNGDL